MVKYEVFALTDVGRKRKQNEDSFLVDHNLNLFVLADGMGGHEAGEVASDNAVKEVKQVIEDNQGLFLNRPEITVSQKRYIVMDLMEKAVQSANSRINKLSRIDNSKKKMGTTLTCLLLVGKHGFIGHVGDSRLYLARNGKIHQLTEDHSLVNQYLKQGRLSKEEAENSPYKNVLTRAVGVQEWVEIDLTDFELENNDRFVLSSDGLTGYLSDDEILSFVNVEKINDTPQKLIDVANERGGRDNITTIVVSLQEVEEEVTVPIKKLKEEKIVPATPSRKIDSLKAVPLFQKLNYQQLTQVANLLEEQVFIADTTIISEGEPGDKFFICLEGSVRVQKGTTTITELHAGDYFGEMALVDNSPRSADVIAIDKTAVLSMARMDLIDLIRRNPLIAIKFLWSFTQVLTMRLRNTSEELSLSFSEPIELTDILDVE